MRLLGRHAGIELLVDDLPVMQHQETVGVGRFLPFGDGERLVLFVCEHDRVEIARL
jgi:hypothetical protein